MRGEVPLCPTSLTARWFSCKNRNQSKHEGGAEWAKNEGASYRKRSCSERRSREASSRPRAPWERPAGMPGMSYSDARASRSSVQRVNANSPLETRRSGEARRSADWKKAHTHTHSLADGERRLVALMLSTHTLHSRAAPVSPLIVSCHTQCVMCDAVIENIPFATQ